MFWDGKERRKFVRVKFPCEITIHSPNRHIISTYTKDISAGGVKLIIKEQLTPNSMVELDLYGIGKNPIACKGKVKWVSAKEDSYSQDRLLYDIGIEFSQIKKKDIFQIKKLVTSLASSGKKTV